MLIRCYPCSTICTFPLQITNRSFGYASPPFFIPSTSFCSIQSSPGSPRTAHITSSQTPPSLSSSITPSAFRPKRKTQLFHQSFPPLSFWFLLDCPSGSWTWTGLHGHWHLFALVSSFAICRRQPSLLSNWSSPHRPQKWSGSDSRSGWKSTPMCRGIYYEVIITYGDNQLWSRQTRIEAESTAKLKPLSSVDWSTVLQQNFAITNQQLVSSSSTVLRVAVDLLSSMAYPIVTRACDGSCVANRVHVKS